MKKSRLCGARANSEQKKKNLIQFTPNFQFFPLLVVRQISERNGEIMRSEMERNKARLGVIKKCMLSETNYH